MTFPESAKPAIYAHPYLSQTGLACLLKGINIP